MGMTTGHRAPLSSTMPVISRAQTSTLFFLAKIFCPQGAEQNWPFGLKAEVINRADRIVAEDSPAEVEAEASAKRRHHKRNSAKQSDKKMRVDQFVRVDEVAE